MKTGSILVMMTFLSFFTANAQKALSLKEIQLIKEKPAREAFRVLQTTDESDLKVLTQKAAEIGPKDKQLQLLADRMYVTVLQEQGVGIAAPQIGISRRAIWVKRYDKAGEPFEFFVNPTITWYSQVKRLGREGCLSIPDLSGQVYRSLAIRITYFDSKGHFHDEMIEGFTAVICQHECDHLEGVLFTDRLEEQAAKTYKKAEIKNELYYTEE